MKPRLAECIFLRSLREIVVFSDITARTVRFGTHNDFVVSPAGRISIVGAKAVWIADRMTTQMETEDFDSGTDNLVSRFGAPARTFPV